MKKKHQRGITLFIVIIIVMLSMLLAIWASRGAWLGELSLSNDVDYQRAFEAAQAMIQDAELDISGKQPDGKECIPEGSAPDICRWGTSITFENGTKEKVSFVEESQYFLNLVSTLEGTPTKCIKGICQKRTGKQDFWNKPDVLSAMMLEGVGARYGQFTGAKISANANPILEIRNSERGAWYWVEVMAYDTASTGSGLINHAKNSSEDGKKKWVLNLKPHIAYRITAIASGLKPHTQVVLQSTYVKQKVAD